MMEVSQFADSIPSELSTGTKRAVAIGRALAQDPEAILYDEPTTMVDPLMAVHTSDLILRLKENDIADVRGRSTLRLARVTKASARGANRFALRRQSVTIERTNSELSLEQRRAIVRLPKPVIEWRQSR